VRGAACCALSLLLGLVLLAGCASAPAPPAVDPAAAARCSAELTAAQVYHETTMPAVGEAHAAGRITGAQLSTLAAAGRRLEAAMRNAHAELRLYLASGETGPTFAPAWDELRAAKANLGLLWEATNGRP
jgi:hypothetical protein